MKLEEFIMALVTLFVSGVGLFIVTLFYDMEIKTSIVVFSVIYILVCIIIYLVPIKQK